MPTKIYLIRHGETDNNINGIMQGWTDVPLNKTGKAQAKKLAKSLEKIKLDFIYSSDLKRASQTAQPLAKSKKQKLITSKYLREQNMGIFEGVNWKKLEGKSKQLLNDLFKSFENKDSHYWNEHKGESPNDFYARLETFFKQLSQKHKDQTVALITHGGTKIRILQKLNDNTHLDS